MIFGFIIKNIKSILDGLIIAGLIVVFALWDPLNFFNSSPKLKDTPVTLRSVKEIGQLITAEYYGEVVESLKDSKIHDFNEDQVKMDAKDLFNDLISSVMVLKEKDDSLRKKLFSLKSRVKSGNIGRKFDNEFPDVVSNYLYNTLLGNLSEYFQLEKESDQEGAVLWHLFSEEPKTLTKYFDDKDPVQKIFTTFDVAYAGQREDSLSGEKVRKEIIYVGRGWVKAGINFQSFEERNFWYDATSGIIYFRDFDPEILDCDINPWFIPEKKIKGFELIVATGRIKDPLEESTKVKIACKQKLRKQAIEAGIINQAKVNAAESLKYLFSLLLDKEIKQVIFTRDKYAYLLSDIGKDSVVDHQEALMLDGLILNDSRQIDTGWYNDFKLQLNDLDKFIGQLKKLKTVPGNLPYSEFASVSTEFLGDSTLSAGEMLTLDSLFIHISAIDSGMYKFAMKKRLQEYYCSFNPQFDDIFEFLKNDSMHCCLRYLGLDTNAMEVKNRVQYILSQTKKKEFINRFLESIDSRLPVDPYYRELFRSDSITGLIAGLDTLVSGKIAMTNSVYFADTSGITIKNTALFNMLTDPSSPLIRNSMIVTDQQKQKIKPALKNNLATR